MFIIYIYIHALCFIYALEARSKKKICKSALAFFFTFFEIEGFLTDISLLKHQ